MFILYTTQGGFYYSFIFQTFELLHGQAQPANNLDCLKLIQQYLFFHFDLVYKYVCTYVNIYACTYVRMYT